LEAEVERMGTVEVEVEMAEMEVLVAEMGRTESRIQANSVVMPGYKCNDWQQIARSPNKL